MEVNQTFSLALSIGSGKKKVVDMKTIFGSPANTLTPAHRGQSLALPLPRDLSVGLVMCISTCLI